MSPLDPTTQRILGAIAVFCVVIGLGAWLLSHFQKRLKDQLTTTDACSPEELLGSFQEAFEAGEMDAAEFEKVREALARESLGSRSPTSRASPAAESTDPTTPA